MFRLAKAHGEDLRREAERDRLAAEARGVARTRARERAGDDDGHPATTDGIGTVLGI